jgi:hypothetical protein
MNEEYINNITLEYLLNPVLYEKICSQKNNSDNLIFKDIQFYRKRMCQITKDMCKGEYINDNLKSVFLNYATTIIYYLKQLDEKDILQSDYTDFHGEAQCLSTDLSTDLSAGLSIDNNSNNLLFNIPQTTNSLDSFVKKINIKQEDTILPQKKVTNIKDPALKNKGLKNKDAKKKI